MGGGWEVLLLLLLLPSLSVLNGSHTQPSRKPRTTGYCEFFREEAPHVICVTITNKAEPST